MHNPSAGTLAAETDAERAARDAGHAAETAARAAGVTVRDLTTLAEIDEVCRLIDRIWHRDHGDPMVTGQMLRALTKAGNYLAGAYQGTEMIGANVGFFGAPDEQSLHSHIAAVSTGRRLRGVGFALKLHQRAWAMHRGVESITWTFDPLVSRNAYFNVAKLGAVAVEYLPHFYGTLIDGINDKDVSDRLYMQWSLRDPSVILACAGHVAASDAAGARDRGAIVTLDRSADGEPVPGPIASHGIAVVAVPADIERMRTEDPRRARRWRFALREALQPLLKAGGRIEGFDRAGWYVFRMPDTPPAG